ncbi:uncharacterized protein BX664DRAFT_328765 [Halteromyces radiatus]|uniref:uncharacterized protein n=1 Tax=Halteromyces radiatus TaxID=101107 RepID=UPI00221F8B24|nr:uncharacterized protein BX664DRAFT_328765 [Halteromyces radiatus]KAI8093030.1 hypothetical protein BX664DRAFT_328765 [Halteromyces radiatus]
MDGQFVENHYQQGKTSVSLDACSLFSGNPCKIHFKLPSSSRQVGLQLYMGRDIIRTVVPVWWYEQDLVDGTKGMCRFEPRNQVRLEALSEDHTRLTLTDVGFSDATVTVMMNPPSLNNRRQEEEQQEEMRGLLYVHSSMIQVLGQKLEQLEQPTILSTDDAFILDRRSSI